MANDFEGALAELSDDIALEFISYDALEAIRTALLRMKEIESGGLVVVPREPTDEMTDAAHDIAEIHVENLGEGGQSNYMKQINNLDDIYKAMLSAAPINPEEKD